MGFALLCDGLLWVRRVEWGGLFLVYGLWAHSQNNHDHLSIFSCGAIFSSCTDVLTLSADAADGTFVVVITSALVCSKLSVVALLIYSRAACV